MVVLLYLDLVVVEIELVGEVGCEIILCDKLEELKEECDFLIIDCLLFLGVLILNVFIFVNEIFLLF